MTSVPAPEQYFVRPSTWVPNSKLPILVYRSVAPAHNGEESISEFLAFKGGWEKKGAWGATSVHHFHPNTHECYAVVRGSSNLLLGRGNLDEPTFGCLINVQPGDVIVVPAGTSHCSATATEDYLAVGVYPLGSPKWRSIHCNDKEGMPGFKEEVESVPLPSSDPVEGEGGWLVKIWTAALLSE